MAQKIGTRKPTQVKSHHQKMEAKYGRAENIIKHLEYLYKFHDKEIYRSNSIEGKEEFNDDDGQAAMNNQVQNDFSC